MAAILTKATLAQHLEEQIGLDTEHATAMVEHFFEAIIHSMEEGNEVILPRLGKFLVRKKNSRPGRNPKTGKAVTVTPRRVAIFQTGATLRKQLSSRPLVGA
jgi:integration host factor subunit alpha